MTAPARRSSRPARGGGPLAEIELDDDLLRLVRRTSALRQGFYIVVLLVALAGQVSGAVETLGIPLIAAVPAVSALELGGIVVLANADVRRRLGERAVASRLLSVAIAASAVTFNWLAHSDHLLGGFFAGMSALGYLVWLMHTENQRRDRLRSKGNLPPTTPAYEVVGHWLRHPWLTNRARALAKADPRLDLYTSLAGARADIRRERRQAAIAKVLHRKIRSAVDPRAADIALAVYDLDEIAGRLAERADYDGLTELIAADLAPDRLARATSADEVAPAGSRRTRRAALKADRVAAREMDRASSREGDRAGSRGADSGAREAADRVRAGGPARSGGGIPDQRSRAGIGHGAPAGTHGANGHPLNGATVGGRVMNGSTADASIGALADGRVANGATLNGAASGRLLGSQAAGGRGTDGRPAHDAAADHGLRGRGVPGQGVNRQAVNGHGVNGHGSNGHEITAGDAFDTLLSARLFGDPYASAADSDQDSGEWPDAFGALDEEDQRNPTDRIAAEVSLRRRIYDALDATVLPGDQRDDAELISQVFDELDLSDRERLAAAGHVRSWMQSTRLRSA